MLLGPLEAHPIEPGTLDVLALMDVMEHLPDPLATLGYGLKLLKPDGRALILQELLYADEVRPMADVPLPEDANEILPGLALQ